MRCRSQLGRVVRGDAPRTAHLRSCQGGFTLIEIVIAVMLISMVVLGLATGFLTLVRTNRGTYEQQQVDHAASSFAESLKAVQYQPCTTSSSDPDYGSSTDAWVPTGGVQVSVVDVEFWNPASKRYQATCPGADGGTQRVTIRSEWRDRDRQAQIVKRNR